MSCVNVITVVALLATALPAASEITVEGDGLELIAEYELSGDVIERNDVRKEEIAALAGNFPFKLFYYYGLSRDKSYFVVFDDSGIPVSFKYADNSDNEWERITPLGDEGDYVKSTNFIHDQYLLQEIYDKDDNLITSIEEFGSPVITKSGSLTAFKRRLDLDVYLPPRIYRSNGDFVAECDFPVNGKNIVPFDKDKDWFIASDPFVIDIDKYPNAERGTKIINENGELAFTLNPDVAGMVLSSSSNKFLYGSDEYICQIGEICTLIVEGNREWYERPDNHVNVLEVYDGGGNPLWSYEWVGEGFADAFGSKILVSDDESVIGLYLYNLGKLLIFNLETGAIDKEIGVFWDGTPNYNDAFISNDSETIAVRCADRKAGLDRYIVIFRDGSYSYISTPRPDDYTLLRCEVSADGKYMLLAVEDGINLYKVTR
jgi:hypothetical protein